jgi:hypothetical protein
VEIGHIRHHAGHRSCWLAPRESRRVIKVGTFPANGAVQLSFMIGDAITRRAGGRSRFGCTMPLHFRPTGPAFPHEETPKDCTAFSGGLAVGFIYCEAGESGREGPHTWFWSIHGIFSKPIDMRGQGTARTLEDAKAYLEENWQRWLRWANLKEIANKDDVGTKTPPTG